MNAGGGACIGVVGRKCGARPGCLTHLVTSFTRQAVSAARRPGWRVAVQVAENHLQDAEGLIWYSSPSLPVLTLGLSVSESTFVTCLARARSWGSPAVYHPSSLPIPGSPCVVAENTGAGVSQRNSDPASAEYRREDLRASG